MPISFVLALLAAMSQDPRPVTLTTTATGNSVELHVRGLSQQETEARYTLEVTSGSGNTSRQSGRARLVPGQEVVLIRLVLAGNAYADGAARLVVETGDGESYEMAADLDPAQP